MIRAVIFDFDLTLADSREGVTECIEGVLGRDALLHEFDAIVGGEDVTNHKPDPEGLLLAIAELALPKPLVVYVGDHPVDAEAAQRAGIRFIGVLSGPSTREEFAAHPTEHMLGSLRQLPAALASLSSAS